MSQYLPPIRINDMFNVLDFSYQYDFISYFNGDRRYVKKEEMKIIVGPIGLRGETGLKGDIGSTGIQGLKGDIGSTGIQGLKGDIGSTGIQGLRGEFGITGIRGLTGIQGLKGDIGSTGIQGLKGDIGSTGIQGLKGDIGSTGIQGLKGEIGAKGDTGQAGQAGSVGEILGSISLIAAISTAVAGGAAFLALSSSNAANLAALNAYIVSNNIQVAILQAKTQFQSFTLDLSETRNSTLFNSNIKVTDGVVGDNEIVNLYVTKPSTFKLGIGVKENIKNEGTLTQIGVSTFNDNIDMVDYVKNPNTNTEQTIIPILKIATTQTGNKIVLYNKNYDVNLNPYICDGSIYGLLL